MKLVREEGLNAHKVPSVFWERQWPLLPVALANIKYGFFFPLQLAAIWVQSFTLPCLLILSSKIQSPVSNVESVRKRGSVASMDAFSRTSLRDVPGMQKAKTNYKNKSPCRFRNMVRNVQITTEREK